MISIDTAAKIADVRPTEILRHGAYLCLNVPDRERARATRLDIQTLAQRLLLRNEFDSVDGHPNEAIAFLRRVDSNRADVVDEELLEANAMVHVAAASEALVVEFQNEFTRLLGATIKLRVLSGVVRPTTFTGNAMHNFAYAHQVIQQPGGLAPNAFLVPLNKTAEWWKKDWMQRHTYFLPRYDDRGRMVNHGHALAAAEGIASLMRRTYKNEHEPTTAGGYDFLTYFECADKDVPTFHRVLESLRDVTKNPEWNFVREGPTWHGRRVRTWGELFT